VETLPTPLLRPQFLALLICPACGAGGLQYDPPAASLAPRLHCRRCGRGYGFARGIPMLYHDDASWAPKGREAAGWLALWDSLGMREDVVPINGELPFGATVEPWITIERMFRGALFQMSLRGGERVLDMGAGEGWAAQHFAARGAEVVAIDIVSGSFGLARAWQRMAYTGKPFDLLVGDNERLPLAASSFDIVFASNALHHHNHLDRLFASAFRVLKPGGRLIAIGDPLATIFQREEDLTDGDREKSFGIIERRRRFPDYALALWRAGFRQILAEDDKSFWQSSTQLYPWMDRQRTAIEANPTLGSRRLTRLLTWTMLRLPRRLALPLLLCLREGGLLMISGRKPT
jgi:SAM-dependent methyltransferase